MRTSPVEPRTHTQSYLLAVGTSCTPAPAAGRSLAEQGDEHAHVALAPQGVKSRKGVA